MKKVFSLLLVAMVLLAFAACGGGGGQTSDSSTPPASGSASTAPSGDLPDEIIIGGLAPLTGGVAQYGIASNNGTMLAVDEINAAGGILGKPIKYIPYDEQGDPTEATTAYDRLVNEDGIVALIGDITTGPTLAVAQKALADNMPMITPTGTGAAITAVGPNIFRTCFTDPYQGELMANYAADRLEATTAAILYDTGDDYSKGVADAFEAAAPALGITITAKEGYQSGAVDFNSQLAKIKEGNPDVVMAPCYYGDAALILAQARDLGIDAYFLGPDGYETTAQKVDPSNYDILNKVYYCHHYAMSDPGPRLQEVIDAYKAKYGEDDENLNGFTILGYESMYIMAAAIEAAGSVDSQAIIDALTNLNYEGVSGAINFGGGQDPAREAVIIEFVDGEEKLLGTYSF
ncbi:ABC transporter substrate-binding protein [Ruminococcaceae bacterium OttesenSCG-928-O06]|nr:ABC transporter substrate-binding protein [Ruminococcaceae bacterium OttesenSCG-928-O06]